MWQMRQGRRTCDQEWSDETLSHPIHIHSHIDPYIRLDLLYSTSFDDLPDSLPFFIVDTTGTLWHGVTYLTPYDQDQNIGRRSSVRPSIQNTWAQSDMDKEKVTDIYLTDIISYHVTSYRIISSLAHLVWIKNKPRYICTYCTVLGWHQMIGEEWWRCRSHRLYWALLWCRASYYCTKS